MNLIFQRATFVVLLSLFLAPGLKSQNYGDSASYYQIFFANNNAFSNFAGGVSLVDFNQDGLDDITLATGLGDSLRFLLNTGTGFTQIPSLVNHTAEAETVLWIDFDNDGDKDLYVSANGAKNDLFRNDGYPVFVKITDSLGVTRDSTSQTYGACWGDYNQDGFLDLYEANRQTNNVTNQLFDNIGGSGLVNTTLQAGVADSLKLGFAPVFFDIDNDRWLDLFVANDKHNGNALFHNQGPDPFGLISFNSVISSANMNILMEAMTATVGDYNDDGYLDVYVTNTPGGNRLFKNAQNGTFIDVTDSLGVAVNGVCWGATFFDYDLDGDQDLYVSDMQFGDTTSLNTLFENVNNNYVAHVAPFPGDTLMSLSHAIADFNGDGHYDIVSPNQQPFALQFWQSSNPNGNKWVKISLEGVVSNRDAISTWIEVHSGGKTQYRFTHCGGPYLAQSAAYDIVGLGSDTLVDTLVLRWHSGHIDSLYNIPSNQHHHFEEGVSVETHAKINGSNWFCQGDSIQALLEVENHYHFTNYEWSTGDTSSSIIATNPGVYWVIGETQYGFRDTSVIMEIFVDSLSISTSSISDTSTLGLGQATVNVSGGIPPFNYTWNDPSAQNTPTAINLTSGNYQVVVTDSLGCLDSMMVFVDNYSGFSLNEYALDNLKLYPNPASDQIQVEGSEVLSGRFELKILDANGRILQALEWNAIENLIIDVKDWDNGLYLLEIRSLEREGSQKTIKFQVLH